MSRHLFAPSLHRTAVLSCLGLSLTLALSTTARAEIHGDAIPDTSSPTTPPVLAPVAPVSATLPVTPSIGGVTLPPSPPVSPSSTAPLTTSTPVTPGAVGTGNKAQLQQIHQNAQRSQGVVVAVVELSDMPPGSTLLKDLHDIKDNPNLSSTYYLDGALTAIFGKIQVFLSSVLQIDGNPHTSYDGMDFTLDPDGAKARSDAGNSIPVPGMAFTDAAGTVHDYALPGDYDAFKAQLNQPVSGTPGH